MNRRDVELLSAYLDGQTSPSDSARLEARLATDPELASALEALRESRTLLRRLPHRRAPRNFTLTPKMVGRRPPLPRAYPVLRFATAFAVLLFAISFISSRVAQIAAPASAPISAYGIGGGAPEAAATEAPAIAMAPAATQPPAMTQAPVATEPPMALATEAPAAEVPAPAPTSAATMEAALPVPTATLPPEVDQSRNVSPQTVYPKNGTQTTPTAPRPLLSTWQIGFGILALLGAVTMLILRFLATRKWRGK